MDTAQFESVLKFSQTAGEFLGALHQPLNEKLQAFFESEDAAQGADGTFAQVAAGVYPKEASTIDLIARSPYNNPDQIAADLQGAAERGWVILSETGFTATKQALKFTEDLVGMLIEYTTGLEKEHNLDMAEIVAGLSQLVTGAEKAPFDLKPAFKFARNYEYEDKTPSLLWVRRHLITLGNYRDDCHLAAWDDLGVSGIEWESLTFVWRGEANSAAELVEKLPFRSYQEEEFAQALAKLVALGWIEKNDGGFGLTEKGKQVREQAETQTDRYYQAAFAAFSEEDLQTLIGSIEALTAAISPKVEENA